MTIQDRARAIWASQKDATPLSVATLLMAELPQDDADRILMEALQDLAREVQQRDRRDFLPEIKAGPSRWDRARAQALRFPVAGGQWRALPDLTVADCEHVAADYERRARENTAWARAMRGLAKQLQQHDAERVGDLPEAVTRDTLDVAA